MSCEVNDVYPTDNVSAILKYDGTEYESPTKVPLQGDSIRFDQSIRFEGNINELTKSIECEVRLDIPDNPIVNTSTKSIDVKCK